MQETLLMQDQERTAIEFSCVKMFIPVLRRVSAAVFILMLVCLEGCGFFIRPQGEVMPVKANAPEFSLPDQKGEQISLRELLNKGPVLLVFYRGHW